MNGRRKKIKNGQWIRYRNSAVFVIFDQLLELQRGDLNVGHTAVSDKVFAEDWNLDGTGNWTDYRKDTDGDDNWDLDEQRDHNEANEITQIEGAATNVDHDQAGNMIKIPKPGDPSDYYDLTYDAWNRLVKVEQDDGQEGTETVAEFEYDGRNYRIVKHTYDAGSLDESRHFFYTAEWQCAEERLEDQGQIEANAAVQYVWGDRYVDDLILRDWDADADSQTGNLGGTGSGLEERLYALQDANWNITALAESDGDIVERYLYDAYGKAAVLNANFTPKAAGTAYDWAYTFTGRRLDGETGLMYYRNRMYHVDLGRFVSRDPIGYAGSKWNLYEYTASNPLAKVDPSGEFNRPGELSEVPVCCGFRDAGWFGQQVWVETIMCKVGSGKTPMDCCREHANGFFNDWCAVVARSGDCGKQKAPCAVNPDGTLRCNQAGLGLLLDRLRDSCLKLKTVEEIAACSATVIALSTINVTTCAGFASFCHGLPSKTATEECLGFYNLVCFTSGM